jgi:hypothetical protein
MTMEISGFSLGNLPRHARRRLRRGTGSHFPWPCSPVPATGRGVLSDPKSKAALLPVCGPWAGGLQERVRNHVAARRREPDAPQLLFRPGPVQNTRSHGVPRRTISVCPASAHVSVFFLGSLLASPLFMVSDATSMAHRYSSFFSGETSMCRSGMAPPSLGNFLMGRSVILAYLSSEWWRIEALFRARNAPERTQACKTQLLYSLRP